MRKKTKISSAGRLARSESAVRDREERLRAILETAVEGIITIDERGIIESFNPASERIFGYKAAEVIGKNVNVLMSTPHREQHDGYLESYQRTGHARVIGIGRETFARRKDGTIFPMDLSVSEVRLSDRRLFTGFVRDITERKHLEKQILEISEREQRRIGQDLHDGLCQHLTGATLAGQVLEEKLEALHLPVAADSSRVVEIIEDGINLSRRLAKGLYPVEIEADGLMLALEEFAATSSELFKVACRFECDSPVLIHDPATAGHLYRIAQEAVGNAIKHGKARNILIRFDVSEESTVLAIKDDGVGLPEPLPENRGLGLRIMAHRSAMIGGKFNVCRDENSGTLVTCELDAKTNTKNSRREQT